ncbi:MAG: metal ABC transporter permease [Chthonomonadales bacterium]
MTWPELFDSLRLNWLSLAASLSIAAICAYIGVYIVLKRIVFVGASLAQISSAGIALAFLLGTYIPWVALHPLVVSLVITLLGTLLYSQQTLSRKIPQEAIIGIGYLVASALTVMFVAKSPKGLDEVNELLAGSTVTLQMSEFLVMVGVFVAVALVHGIFYKQFLFVSFDREMAATQGYNTRGWELLFYLTLGFTISVAIQSAGLLAVFAYLVIPAVTGLLVARRMPAAFTVAIGTALVSTFLGFTWALKVDLPSSPPIIAVAAIILAIVWTSRRFVHER